MRKRSNYIDKYGPIAGDKLYHALQSQAAHAGVSARLRRKLRAIMGGHPWPPARKSISALPLFPERETELEPEAATAQVREPEAQGV